MPFSPPHHVLWASHSSSKCRKVYFFTPKGISYNTIWNSSMFYPGGFTSGSYIVTPKLPPSYTIVPFNEWGLFTLAALTTGSLVCIHAAGTYWDALGYVIGSSTNPANECALVAVVSQIKYPDIHYLMEDQHHVIPPPSKIESLSYHPQLFDLSHLLIQEQKDRVSSSLDVHTVVYDDSFQRFFKMKFPSIYTDGMEHQLDITYFLFQVYQREVDYGVIKESSSRCQAANMGIIDKIPPVYHYCGHLYYLGVCIILIF